MILITRHSSRVFSGMLAVMANPGTGARSPQRATTNWLRAAQRPSRTMQPNSGLLRVPIRRRRCGWRE